MLLCNPGEAKMAEWKTKISVPQQLLVPISVPNALLLGPGPANPSMRTYNASAMPLLVYLHPEFCKIKDETKAGLQYVFQTRNEYTLAITGAGHAAMEASIVNLVERGERILVCVNGFWGSRAREIAERQGEKGLGPHYHNKLNRDKCLRKPRRFPVTTALSVIK